MKNFLLLSVMLLSLGVYSQKLYKDQIYEQVNRLTMTYADTLKTDVYFVPERDQKGASPLILLVHGGGFYAGKRNGELESGFATDMAGRGYVVASIEYDLTRKGKKEGFGCDCPAEDKINTFKHAVTNLEQALEFLLKFHKEFGFDPQRIILAGSSAGAEAVLHATYAADHDAFQRTTKNNRAIFAVVAFAGALLNDVRVDDDRVPAFLVHGADDAVVPYAAAPHRFCAEDNPGFLPLKGSESIAEELKNAETSYAFYVAGNGGHEWANKGYQLTDELSEFLYTLLQKGWAGQVTRMLQPEK